MSTPNWLPCTYIVVYGIFKNILFMRCIYFLKTNVLRNVDYGLTTGKLPMKMIITENQSWIYDDNIETKTKWCCLFFVSIWVVLFTFNQIFKGQICNSHFIIIFIFVFNGLKICWALSYPEYFLHSKDYFEHNLNPLEDWVENTETDLQTNA